MVVIAIELQFMASDLLPSSSLEMKNKKSKTKQTLSIQMRIFAIIYIFFENIMKRKLWSQARSTLHSEHITCISFHVYPLDEWNLKNIKMLGQQN